MKKKFITEITNAQRARFPEFVQKWTDIGLSTQPADREKAERAIRGLYALARLKEPRVIWLPCPFSAAISVVVYASIVAARLTARSAAGGAIDGAVRRAVRGAVDDAVSGAVSNAVRGAIDDAVSGAVGDAIDGAVGVAVGVAISGAVDGAVDGAVSGAVYSYFGGSFWAAYSAWTDYFSEVFGISIDRNYLDLTESCGYYWTLDSICFASERPSHINRDDRGRLHSETGQSIGYRCGWGLWHWHSVQVPREVIEQPDSITGPAIIAEQNAEVRRAMIERIGYARFLAEVKAKEIDRDPDPRWGTLFEVPDVPVRFVKVRNCSPEPDGTFKDYVLAAPRECQTAKDAVLWTWDIDHRQFEKLESKYGFWRS